MKTLKIGFAIMLIFGIMGGLSLGLGKFLAWKVPEGELYFLYMQLGGIYAIQASRIALDFCIIYFFYLMIVDKKIKFEFEFEKPNTKQNDD